jgi:hypothetical protein
MKGVLNQVKEPKKLLSRAKKLAQERLLKRILFLFFLLFVLEALTVRFYGSPLQELSAQVTLYFQSLLNYGMTEEISEFVHHSISSHAIFLI